MSALSWSLVFLMKCCAGFICRARRTALVPSRERAWPSNRPLRSWPLHRPGGDDLYIGHGGGDLNRWWRRWPLNRCWRRWPSSRPWAQSIKSCVNICSKSHCLTVHPCELGKMCPYPKFSYLSLMGMWYTYVFVMASYSHPVKQRRDKVPFRGFLD